MNKVLTVLFYYASLVFGFEKNRINLLLRSTAIHNPPFDEIISGSNGTLEFIGSTRNVINWLGQRLRCNIDFVFPSQEHFKLRSVEASVDLVVEGKADFTSNGYFPTSLRLQIIDTCSFFIWEEGYRLLVPVPEEEHRLFAFVHPFQFAVGELLLIQMQFLTSDPKVWMLLGGSIITASLGMSFLSWYYGTFHNDRLKRNRKTSILEYIGNNFMYNINMLTSHGEYIKESRFNSFLVFISFWLMGTAVLVYGYSSVVVSSLTLPRRKTAIDSFEDILASENVNLILRTDVYIGMLIMNLSEAPLHKALREKVQKNPEGLLKDSTKIEKLLLSGRYATPLTDTVLRFSIGNLHKKDRKRRFKPSSRIQSIPNNYFYQLHRKDSKLIERLVSRGMMELWETGLSGFWVRNRQPKTDECSATKSNRPLAKITSIKLVDLTSAFFILGIGFAISVLSFLCERFYYISDHRL